MSGKVICSKSAPRWAVILFISREIKIKKLGHEYFMEFRAVILCNLYYFFVQKRKYFENNMVESPFLILDETVWELSLLPPYFGSSNSN